MSSIQFDGSPVLRGEETTACYPSQTHPVETSHPQRWNGDAATIRVIKERRRSAVTLSLPKKEVAWYGDSTQNRRFHQVAADYRHRKGHKGYPHAQSHRSSVISTLEGSFSPSLPQPQRRRAHAHASHDPGTSQRTQPGATRDSRGSPSVPTPL